MPDFRTFIVVICPKCKARLRPFKTFEQAVACALKEGSVTCTNRRCRKVISIVVRDLPDSSKIKRLLDEARSQSMNDPQTGN